MPATKPLDHEAGLRLFESVMPEYREVMIDAPRREADDLVSGFVGDSSHIAKVRRQRAGILRAGATRAENWIVDAREAFEKAAMRRAGVNR